MITLHKNPNDVEKLVSEEGQRGFLCSNNKPVRCPSSDFTNFDNASEDDQLDYLAEILLEGFLDKQHNEKLKHK